MKFTYTVDAQPVVLNGLSLHLMVNRLMISTMPQALRRQTIIVNEIQPGFSIEADEPKLAVIANLINAIIGHSKNCTIAISAKQVGHVTLVHIKTNYRLYSRSFADKLAEIREKALKAGASVSVTSFRNNITTLAIGFMNYSTVN